MKMDCKILLIIASALFFESAFSQCICRGLAGPYGAGWPYDGLSTFDALAHSGAWPTAGCGAGLGSLAPATGLAAAYGGGLAVTSASPIAPTGLTVTSENAIEGPVAVVGQLPFLGVVVTDGVFPTVGAGAVSYGCGDGAIGIVSEGPLTAGTAIAPAASGLGYGPALPGGLPYNGRFGLGGCGCGTIY